MSYNQQILLLVPLGPDLCNPLFQAPCTWLQAVLSSTSLKGPPVTLQYSQSGLPSVPEKPPHSLPLGLAASLP